MKCSVRLNNDLPVAQYPVLAQAAERAGFDQLWVSDDLFLRGVWPILSACALATSRIELGTCIVNPYTMHPAEIAMQAAALDELSGGRFNLGLAAGAGEFLDWVGLPHPRPLETTATAIRALRALFAGEHGAAEWGEPAYLRFETRRIPIYLGATGPRMQRMIGELADGGLPLLFPPEHFAAVRALVHEGAAAAGRAEDDIDLAACIWVSVDEDHAAAENVLRDKIAYYGAAMGTAVLSRLGVTTAELAPMDRAVQIDGDLERARALVPPAMLAIGIAGSARDLLPRLEGLVAAGARHLSFGPPLGPDPLQAIETLGSRVLPHLR
jgi:5,10-methylenetetrahydromethanopterin reductase